MRARMVGMLMALTAMLGVARPRVPGVPGVPVIPGVSAHDADPRRTIVIGGRERDFFVHLPPAYDGTRSLPVVIVLHGGTGNAIGAAKQTGMSAKADAAGFIAVYPNGTGIFRDRLLTWNAGACCGYAEQHHVDDIAFLRAMLDTMRLEFHIDPSRVYATGISNGGMLAYRAACEMADRLTAIAPVEGAMMVNTCAPARPVSLVIVHGTADENVPYDGGINPKGLVRQFRPSVDSMLTFWTRVDGCPPSPKRETLPSVEHVSYGPCASGSAVELYKVIGGQHSWPGGERMSRLLDPPSTALHATDAIWKFFSQRSASAH